MSKEEEIKEREDLSRLLASLSKKELVEITKYILIEVTDAIKEKEVSYELIYDLAKQEAKKGVYQIPISIFVEELSVLESVVKYLKESLMLRHSEIAEMLNRDERNIWTTYRNAVKKKKERFVIKKPKLFIPIIIFQDRRLSMLESLVVYLKERKLCKYHEIAILLNRDDRTIWTVYHRAQIKRKI